MVSKLVLASANPDKIIELAKLLVGEFEVVPRPKDLPETIEDADTLEGNAIKKATEVCEATALPSMADDTGLFVDSLGGEPGVYSARYAGEDVTYSDNVNKLLFELKPYSISEERTASFRTVIALVWPDGSKLLTEGEVKGKIASELKGGDGFGYDPVFVPDEGDGRSFAQMSRDEKNQISHRSRAVKSLISELKNL